MKMALSRKRIRRRLKRSLLLPPLPYQVDGIHFFERAGGRALNCDDMGVGKSLQAIGYSMIHPGKKPIIILCPASLKWMWQQEWKKFTGLQSHVCEGEVATLQEDKQRKRKRMEEARKHKDHRERRRIFREIGRGFRRRREATCAQLRAARGAEIIILNYDILSCWLPFLLELAPQLLIIDECHYVKTRSAKRTKACKELAKRIKHVLALSGTPISGKPAEFFSVLQMIRPKEFSSFWKYGMEFCNPSRNPFTGGWNFDGASNLDTLHHRLKKIMIRRMKKQVLKDLPKKVRTVIPVDIANRKEYDEAEENFLSWLKEKKGNSAMKRAMRAQAVVKIGMMKQLAAAGKMNHAIEWIRNFLEGSNEKLIVFAYHRRILRALRKAFPKALLLDGSVSNKSPSPGEPSARQKMVNRFQTKKKYRLILCQTKVGGQGHTLTAACNVLKLELGWNPGDHDQAEDRALRIGQTKQVNIYYMVGRNTIEERILRVLEHKDKVTGRILDGRRSAVLKLLSMYTRMVD